MKKGSPFYHISSSTLQGRPQSVLHIGQHFYRVHYLHTNRTQGSHIRICILIQPRAADLNSGPPRSLESAAWHRAQVVSKAVKLRAGLGS